MGVCSKLSFLVALIAIVAPIIWKYKDQREFNFRTTADEAANGIDLTGKIIIVTGTNTGIGKPTARVLVERGAIIIMGCRNITKANKAKQDIIKQLIAKHPLSNKQELSDRLIVMELDLASIKSVDKFSNDFKKKYDLLHYLILNAGVSVTSWRPTKDGIESDFGINHVGHFQLTMNLTPLMIKTASIHSQIGRVIVVASWASKWAPYPLIDWLNNDTLIQNKDAFDTLSTYSFSKACNILFAMEYNERYKDKDVYAISVHPGTIATELMREAPEIFKFVYREIFGAIILKNEEEGAATTIRTISITDDEFKKNGGNYFSDCNEANGDLRSDVYPPNKTLQTMLWKLTESMIKECCSSNQIDGIRPISSSNNTVIN